MPNVNSIKYIFCTLGLYVSFIKDERVNPLGHNSLILIANQVKIKRQAMFGTVNQNNPAIPCVYAFKVATNKAGAHIQVAEILKPLCNQPIFLSATK